MCDIKFTEHAAPKGARSIPLEQALGLVLAHDITEMRKGEFKGRAFKKGHVVQQEDMEHLRRLGKEHLYIIEIAPDEMHEDDAAHALAHALAGTGVEIKGEPKEGKLELVATHDGLLKINTQALLEFNMLGEVMCATLHTNTPVRAGQTIAGTRAIPLVVKRSTVQQAVLAVQGQGAVRVIEMRKPRAGVVITGNEVYYGRIKDAFGPVMQQKVRAVGGELVGMYFAPDDEQEIMARMRELLAAGADLLITTGGMSVDPDDVTRHAVRMLGAEGLEYGSAVLPGAMFMVAYIEGVPVLGVPACGMYHKTTVFDLVLPRVLAGERIGRRELAELGHGGLCQNCPECHYPICPLGK